MDFELFMKAFIRIIVYISIYIGLFTLVFYLLGFLKKSKKLKNVTDFPFCSIIIPAYNEENTLEKTIKSAISLNYPKNKFEILIIDDGSTDKTFYLAKKFEKEYSNVRAFTKKNGGKASAMNFGIDKSKGEFVISFDADSMVTSDSLRQMMPYFYDKDVMCVTPGMKVYKPKGILQRVQAIEYDFGIFLRKALTRFNSVNVTPGPFSIYRKVFFEKYGGYDEKNITEDMEIAMRIQYHNYKIENSPESVVYTIAPNKLYALARQRRRWYFGMINNLWKYRDMFGKRYGELGIITLPLSVISVVMVMTVTLYYIYRFIIDSIRDISLYSLIGFDFWNNLHVGWNVFLVNLYKYLSEPIILFATLFIILNFTMLLYVNRRIKSIDRPISIFLNYVFFLYIYGILFSFWWIIAIIYSIFKKEIKW